MYVIYSMIYTEEPPQKKKTAILNMYWTDIGLWKLMEIVKTHGKPVSDGTFPN